MLIQHHPTEHTALHPTLPQPDSPACCACTHKLITSGLSWHHAHDGHDRTHLPNCALHRAPLTTAEACLGQPALVPSQRYSSWVSWSLKLAAHPSCGWKMQAWHCNKLNRHLDKYLAQRLGWVHTRLFNRPCSTQALTTTILKPHALHVLRLS